MEVDAGAPEALADFDLEVHQIPTSFSRRFSDSHPVV